MPQFKVVVATDLSEEGIEILQNASDVEVVIVTPTPVAVREALPGAHVIISRDEIHIDVEFLNHAPDLQIIGRITSGINGIDVEAATARGILVMNTPGINAIAAGEHTLALMLALTRRLVVNHNSLKEGWWLLDRKQQAGTQLSGKTLGIVGLGRVGTLVSKRCLAFGMNVIAYDPYVNETQLPDRVTLVGFDDLIETSDFITLHLPETRETNMMFNSEVIERMKPNARIINTAGGAIVDEHALAKAIKEGKIAGAAVDVYGQEPPYNSPLVGLDNVIHTPHISDNTIEAMQDVSIQIVKQVMDALHDEDYRNVVNMPVIPGMNYEVMRPYMMLGESIGRILHTLSRAPLKRVAVELRGDEMTGLIKPMTVAILKGLLTPLLGKAVSYVNAPVIATERGWHITQAKGLKTSDYTDLVTAQVTLEDGDQITISGTLLDHKEPHIIQINQYRMNFVPRGYLLIMGSYDKPGIIGKIGTLMASESVNIASWQTGRAEPGGNTLTVITTDERVPDSIMNQLTEHDFVRHARQVKIE